MNTVLFDLDGTLLPLDQGAFTKIYFAELSKKCAAFGYDPALIPAAVWAGTKEMVRNDGAATNEQRFWDCFAAQLGPGTRDLKPALERFYVEEFHAARAATRENPPAATLVRRLRSAGLTVVLASNPLFPLCAYATRLGWVGLSLDDFDLVTAYGDFHYCKPNPAYFLEILERTGKRPEDCLMVGNDAEEDAAAAAAGIPVVLTTDCLINEKARDLSAMTCASFAEMAQWLLRHAAA